MMKIQTYVCVILIVLGFQLSAQRTTYGHIYDADTKEAIIGANIYTSDIKYGTSTDINGYYVLETPDSYDSLYISYVGYKTLTVPVRGDKASDYYLKTPTFEEVKIVAQKIPTRNKIGHVGLTKKQIESIPTILGEADVLKSFQMLPGVSATQEGSTGFIVRGGAQGQNQYLLDGTPIYNMGHLFGYISPLNSSLIKYADLTKSGFPSRYGGGLSSVLNLNTIDGNREKHTGEVKVGLINSSVQFNGPLLKDRLTYVISARMANLAPVTLLTKYLYNKKILENYYAYTLFDGNVKLKYSLSPTSSIRLMSYLSDDNINTFASDSHSETRTKIRWGNRAYALNYNSVLRKNILFQAGAYHTKYIFNNGQKERILASGDELSLLNRSFTRDLSLKSNVRLIHTADRSTEIGIQGIHRKVMPRNLNYKESKNASSVVVDRDSAFMYNGVAYAEHQMKLGDKWHASLGLRYDIHTKGSYRSHHYAPRIQFSYAPNKRHTWKVSYDVMNQPIHLLLSREGALFTEFWIPSSAKVPVGTSDQLSIDYSLDTDGFLSSLSAGIYYKNIVSGTRLKDVESKIFDPDYDWKTNISLGIMRIYGLELLARKDRGRLTGWLGYTYTHSESQFYGVNNNRWFPSDFIPRHEIEVTAQYKLSDRWDISSNFALHSGHPQSLATAIIKNPLGGYKRYIPSINNVFPEPYHRLDLGATRTRETKRGNQAILGFGVYNAYFALNPYKYGNYTEEEIGKSVSFKVRKYSYLNFLPYINYTYKF